VADQGPQAVGTGLREAIRREEKQHLNLFRKK
jgi:hypothetical protein